MPNDSTNQDQQVQLEPRCSSVTVTSVIVMSYDEVAVHIKKAGGWEDGRLGMLDF